MTYPDVEILGAAADLGPACAGFIARLAAEAAGEGRGFNIAIPGGSALDIACSPLATEPISRAIDWSGWRVFWADERCVPHDSPESNYAAAMRVFLSRVPIAEPHIHRYDDRLGAEEAADAYESVLAEAFGVGRGQAPVFDLILLGLGEDGHIASLFPGRPSLLERRRCVAAVKDAPKQPRERITLTLPVINNARHVMIVASGAGKADIVRRALDPEGNDAGLPARMLKPVKGYVRWFLDAESGSMLQVGG